MVGLALDLRKQSELREIEMTTTNFPNGITVSDLTVGSTTFQPQWQVARKTVTFAGGTTNAHGDYDGTGNPYTLFTVTGDVLVYVFAKCTTDIAGASATVEVGVTGNTASIIAQTTGTDIDNGDVWRDANPAVGAEAINGAIAIIGGLDIIETTATANATGGVLTYYCMWYPLSTDGNVVAA
jgi:hypothetical protein